MAIESLSDISRGGTSAFAPSGPGTDLSLGTRTTTTIPLNSSTGADVTLPAATTSLAGLQSAADKTKLDGIATAATANATDAVLKDRANHTGVQAASTISDFAETVRATVLTGLSTASAVAVAATDTVLAAIGKLQAQINGLSAANYTNLTLQAPYIWDSAGDAASYHQPSYAKVGDVVRLRGKVTLSGTHADGSTVNVTTIATLPAGFRPAKRKVFQVFWDTGSPLHFAYCLVVVNTDGAIILLMPSTTQPYPFTGGHLPLDQIWFDLALDCADYPYPAPTSVVTDLDADIVNPTPTSVDTNLCSEIV